MTDDKKKVQPSEEFLFQLSRFFDYAGMNNPFNRIYITIKSKEEYADILFVFVIGCLQKLYLYTNTGMHNFT